MAKRRPQASKTARYQAGHDPTALFTQTAKLSQCGSTGQTSFSLRSAAQARANAIGGRSQSTPRVTECLECDGYHVEGVYS